MATGTGMDSTFTDRSTTAIPLLVLLMTTIFLDAPPVAGEPPSVVPFACKGAAAASGGAFTEAFCLSTLHGSKSTVGAADYADLALVAVDLATANATATEAMIDALLAAGTNGATPEGLGLQSCRALYGAVVRQYQPECRAAVKDGRYGDGKACLGRTAQAAAACERWFQQRKVASPVAREDDALAKLASLAIALASIA
jgi:pectinesterase inhibitor-like protein